MRRFGDRRRNDDQDDVTNQKKVGPVLPFFLPASSSFQERLKRRNFLAARVVHVAIGISRRPVRNLQVLVAVNLELRQLGQTRELFWDAAWRAAQAPIPPALQSPLRAGCRRREQFISEAGFWHHLGIQVVDCGVIILLSVSLCGNVSGVS